MSPPFFNVSLRKLAVLSICTMGLYQLYWFYAHWRQVRMSPQGRDFSPARRTVLLFFYIYPLLRRIRALDVRVNGRSRLQAGLLALAYLGFNLLDVLPGLWAFLSMLSFVFLLPAQARANQLNLQLYAGGVFDRNESFTVGNWVVIVVGGLLVVLSVVAVLSGH